MSSIANRLNAANAKLKEAEKKITELKTLREKEIGKLARKMDALAIPDEVLIGMFIEYQNEEKKESGKKGESAKLKEWFALGENFLKPKPKLQATKKGANQG